MKKYVCEECGYVYDPAKGDPDSGIEPGTPFEAIPDDWSCPKCGASKSAFKPQLGDPSEKKKTAVQTLNQQVLAQR